MDNHHDNSTSFWKTSSRAVPGRPSPKKDNIRHGAFRTGRGHHSTFQDFQESVSDAWDMGDDEFCIISGIFMFIVNGVKNIFLLQK